jgi:hypothetical protein
MASWFDSDLHSELWNATLDTNDIIRRLQKAEFAVDVKILEMRRPSYEDRQRDSG